MKAGKGLDTGDKVLAHALASRMIHALRQQWRRGTIQGEGKVKGARVWALQNAVNDMTAVIALAG